MKYYNLSAEEQQELEEIEAALDNDHLDGVQNLNQEKKRLQLIARNSLNKPRNINIRLSERDLHRLKVKAAREGIPYQTLATSILHKSSVE